MKLYYRPEIDGLRAIAVISVILYHAKFTLFGVSLFTGGFLGVEYLDHFNLICDTKKKSCLISTTDNKIIHRDTAGHVTEYGGNFIAQKIIARNWFNLK